MDFLELRTLYQKDTDFPERCFDIQMFRRVLEGTQYDILRYPFYQTYTTSVNEYIPLSQRRPSVRYRLSKIVVDQSVALLFGEAHFPLLLVQDNEPAQNFLYDIVDSCHLNLLMMDAATKGSTGSVAVFLRVIEGRPYLESCYTEYLTPVFKKTNPNELESVIEKCKRTGQQLIDLGYKGLEKEKLYWFMRIWDSASETYYNPWPCSEKKVKPSIDKDRTVTHGLGFVPIVWVKNLPGGDSDIDGLCTFKDAIDTNIELDYQMSQCGRGLKYSSEPLLLIKNPALNQQKNIVAEGNVIEVDENGDAKHIEIKGDACKAVLEYAKRLREVALENISGNRSTPEKTHAVQSGKAMEMLNLSLIWLSDKLRISYGEVALVNLLMMFVKILKKHDLVIGNNTYKKNSIAIDKIQLKWPDWFPSTKDDRQKEAIALTMLKDGGIISNETAIAAVSDEYDIPDVSIEYQKIKADQAEFRKENKPTTTQLIKD